MHGGASPLACECIDLASNGVGLRSATKVKKGSKVAVVLSLGDRSVALHAVVKRCRAQAKQWVLGLQFTAVDSESATLLDAFVDGALHRDVRMYQAQVFLARTGARSLEEVLGAKPPLPAAAPEPSEKEGVVAGPVDDAVDGSAPITIDEPAPSGYPVAATEVPAPAVSHAPISHAPISHAPISHAPMEASADLRHAVATALHDVSHELSPPNAGPLSAPPKRSEPPHEEAWPRGDFGDAPPKGGTMLRPNPLFDLPEAPPPGQTLRPPSAVVTSPGLRAPEPSPAPPTGYAADVSALRYDDGPDSEGRPGRRTTVVDPRTFADRTQLRPPPLRVERSSTEAASFQPRIDELDLDDAPTRMFGDTTKPEPRTFFTPPSPFGGGRVRTVVLPSTTSTMVAPHASVDAPTPIPIPGHAEPRTPALSAERGATQVAIPAARTMPYGPLRGESTEVAIPAQGLPRPGSARDEATGSGGPRPPSPFSGRESPPPSPFTSSADRDHALDEAATRLRDHPLGPGRRPTGAARDDAQNERDAELAARYGRALTDLDLENR